MCPFLEEAVYIGCAPHSNTLPHRHREGHGHGSLAASPLLANKKGDIP